MDYAGAIALVVAVTTGVIQILLTVAALIRVLRTEAAVEHVGRGMNGRLDALLVERELRVRAEHAAELERLRVAALGALAQPVRPEGLIVQKQSEQQEG